MDVKGAFLGHILCPGEGGIALILISFLWICLHLEEMFLVLWGNQEYTRTAAVVSSPFSPKIPPCCFPKGWSAGTMKMQNFKVKRRRKSFGLNFNIHLREELMTLKTSIMQGEIGKASLHVSISALLYDWGRNLSQKQRQKSSPHFILLSKAMAPYVNRG